MPTENPHTSRPSESPGNSLQSSTPATLQQIMVEIARLEIHCPVFSPMTQESRREWIVTLCKDLAHKTLDELQYGARRYRTAIPPNKWFPTSGAWLEACKNPFDQPPRRYAELPLLPDPMPEDRAKDLIEATRKKFNYSPEKENAALAKEDILARPRPIMTPEMQAREKALTQERLDTLARRLPERHS